MVSTLNNPQDLDSRLLEASFRFSGNAGTQQCGVNSVPVLRRLSTNGECLAVDLVPAATESLLATK